MKNIIKTVTFSTLLSVSTVYGGGDIIPPVSPVSEVSEIVDTNPFYIGVGAIWAGVSRDCVTQNCPVVRLKDSTWGGIVRAGYDFNEYIGIEARALKANIDSDWAETTHYGIYLKPFIPISERINIYGLLGYGHTKIITDCEIQETYTRNGFSYGLGIEFDLSNKQDDYDSYKKHPDDVLTFDRPFDGHGDQEVGWGLWIDWQNLMNNAGPNNYKTNIISFGITYDF